jgi:hypothetical protein
VIFFLTVKMGENGNGSLRYRFVTAEITVQERFLKPWVF